MRIEFEIPDWAEDRHIYIMAGLEMLAFKKGRSNILRLKKDRCGQCGICCGECEHLKKEGDKFICALGQDRPWACLSGDKVTRDDYFPNDCKVTYEEIELS